MSDLAEKNRQVFDKMSSSYMDGFADSIALLCRQTLSRRHWFSDYWTDTETGKGKEIKMLEYACGPGAISATLAPYVTKILGLDVSEKMIEQYNKNAENTGFADKMSARTGDLLADNVPAELSGPEYNDFDVVVVSMALHHFQDPAKALKALGARLKKNGVFIILDLLPEESSGHDHHHHHHHHHGHSHGHSHDHPPQHNSQHDGFPEGTGETIGVFGFDSDTLKGMFENAGFSVNYGYEVIDEPFVFTLEGKTYSKTVFAAKAQRA